MANKKGKEKGRTRKKRDRGIHIVPDILAVAGVGDLALESTTEAGNSPYTYFMAKDFQNAVGSLMDNVTTWEGLKAPIILEIAAVAAKWVGKKTGLNKVGTTKVKLF
jgi:hypothetical protein